MKRILLNALKIFGIKIAMCFITVCMMLVFTWLFELSGGFLIYSAIMSAVMFAWLFTEGRSAGKKRIAKEQSHLLGALSGAIAEIPSLIILLLMFLIPAAFSAFNIAFWGYNATMMGFFRPDGKLLFMTQPSPFYFLPFVITPAAYGLGYLFGCRGIEFSGKFTENMVYKKSE